MYLITDYQTGQDGKLGGEEPKEVQQGQMFLHFLHLRSSNHMQQYR